MPRRIYRNQPGAACIKVILGLFAVLIPYSNRSNVADCTGIGDLTA
jgi:hypothetical protein